MDPPQPKGPTLADFGVARTQKWHLQPPHQWPAAIAPPWCLAAVGSPKEVHGGHQTTPGGTGDIRAGLVAGGGALDSPWGAEKPYFAAFADLLPSFFEGESGKPSPN